MHDRDERLSRFRCELLVAAARVRQEPQPERSLNRTIRKSIAQVVEHWADTVDTIDDKQIAEFDAAASGIGDDEFSECMHQATFEGWEDRTAETASEFIAIGDPQTEEPPPTLERRQVGVPLLPAPALRERRDRGLARHLVAVRRALYRGCC